MQHLFDEKSLSFEIYPNYAYTERQGQGRRRISSFSLLVPNQNSSTSHKKLGIEKESWFLSSSSLQVDSVIVYVGRKDVAKSMGALIAS